MSGTRERDLPCKVSFPPVRLASGGTASEGGVLVLGTGTQKTVSEGHRFNRSKGYYDSGGPFYTSRVEYQCQTGTVGEVWGTTGSDKLYSGPVYTDFPSPTERSEVGFKGNLGDSNESTMRADGATAISLASPVNPNAQLATLLGETRRDGLPSLPGIRTWRDRTLRAKNAGDEYLNVVFGWEPLVRDVHDVGNAARHHRNILVHYEDNEGSNNHRTFAFPSDEETKSIDKTVASAKFKGWNTGFVYSGSNPKISSPTRTITRVTSRRRWFEGVFTYATPSSTDSWGKGIRYGREADHLFGVALTPTVLWELAPWSWAVDWFSNAGNVINNVTNFALAGQVMRYGYMMEETIEKVTASIPYSALKAKASDGSQSSREAGRGGCSSSIVITTKRRVAADPFGFSVGWEGLSLTQLAIAASLGISRFL